MTISQLAPVTAAPKEISFGVSKPHLIMRAKIRRPLVATSVRLGEAVELEYMGSSEFEGGATGKSLRWLEDAGRAGRRLRVMTLINENDQPLRVLSKFNDAEFQQYSQYLLRMRNEKEGQLRLLEPAYFDPSTRPAYAKCDFWWDLNNHVMWSFHKPFMKRLEYYLQASFLHMNEQRAARTKGDQS